MLEQKQPGNRRAGQQFDEEVSANVRDLIQETELAFEAVGNAVNDAQMISRLPDSLHSSAPSPNVPRTHPRGPSPSATETHQAAPQPKAAEPKLSTKKSGNALRRAMMEGVGGKLLGQRFKRIVADEMLTPARIEELKKKREQAEAEEEAKLQLACDVSNNEQGDKSTTPLEPFYLESLVTQQDAPAVESLPKEVENKGEDVSGRLSPEVLQPEPQRQSTPHQDVSESVAMTGDSLFDNSFTFLAPPSRSPTPGRFGEPKRLSTIPEDSGPSQRQSLHQPMAAARPAPRRDSDDEFIYLTGTDISCANRSFRHGPIACHRPEPTKRDAELEVDDAVDWTAFHMAIMGGAGDLASGLYEDEQNDMADEMAEWFDEFGFDSPGLLIPSSTSSSRSSSQSEASSSPSTIDSDADLPIPVQMEHPSSYHAHSRSAGSMEAAMGPFDSIRFFRSSSLRRWRAMEEPAFYEPSIRRNSAKKQVARPNPVVVGGEDYGDVTETVADMAPMGCNLESDLGDYLRWGSQHVGDPL
ncbi:C6 finger domain-containingprotein [Purpureocillium lavendulum]|uniref:C6 finger domain-containingprotein n=1 Tax=Purpureocillium lavendulum TaxID=1247861 RepID=A0AB34FUA1_9HYPO|nr:C6 finger domain-containingprotein [Purpureocillium lavendulum]